MSRYNRYSVTFPDGKIAKRPTSTRIYTHVVAMRGEETGGEWRIANWCGRPDLAEKAKSFLDARSTGLETVILPAVQY